MKYLNNILAFIIMSLTLWACDGRLLDDDERGEGVTERLTARAWRQMGDESQTVDVIYRFSANGRGECKSTITDDKGSVSEHTRRFDWNFTTPNRAVIFMYDGYSREYWLIDKLTDSNLDVTAGYNDPVIYPDQYNDKLRFQAVGN